MHYPARRASLVMMRSGVQFSLAAPRNPQWLLQNASHWLHPARLRELQLRAERVGNTQSQTGNSRAVCSLDGLGVRS